MNIPDWAKYLATNEDGTVYAFEEKPGIYEISSERTESGSEEVWEPDDDSGYMCIGMTHPDLFWRESLKEVIR